MANTAGGEPASPAGSAPPPGGDASPAAEVDVERLAEKVYRLMLAEARLARARGVQPRRPAKVR